MHTFDSVYDLVSGASYEIDLKTADYVFGPEEVPAELSRKLINIQLEIDRLARLAKTHVENHESDFGPTETWFDMPATIRIHWSRENQSLVDATLHVDTGWSPSNVEDEDENRIATDDRQCESWRRSLRNEIDGYQLA